MGRSFTEEETSPQTDKAVILTDTYWRRRFGADPRVIGRQLRVNGIMNTVVGVLPPGFRFLSSEARLYFPFSSSPGDRVSLQRHSGGNFKHMIARLKPGATLAQACGPEIDAQNFRLEADDPAAKMMADAGFRSVVAPLHVDLCVRGTDPGPALLWMQAGAFALLLIGLVNLTNLLLIRASSRSKEIAVRQALGASRWHLISETIVETTLLTLAGGLLGLAAGAGGIRLLGILAVDRLPLGSHIAIDYRLACIAVFGAAAIGLVLSVPIAWFNLRAHLAGRDPPQELQRNAQPGSSKPAPWIYRRADRIGNGSVERSGSAGSESGSGRWRSRWSFWLDHVLSGQISVLVNRYPDWPARRAFHDRLLKPTSRASREF